MSSFDWCVACCEAPAALGGDDLCVGCAEQEAARVCRSGCRTQDHASYGECLRSAGIQIGNLK